MKPIHIAAAVFVMLIWGSNFAIVKLGLLELPPLFMVGLRFALVAVILVPFVSIPRSRFGWVIVLSVVLGSLHFSLMFMGIVHVDAGTAAVAIQLQAPFAVIMAALWLNDRLEWRCLIGMAFAFAGVVVLSGAPKLEDNLGALALVISASFVWAVANLVIKKMGPMDGFQLNGWVALLAFPQLLLASVVLETGQVEAVMTMSWRAVLVIGYLILFVTIIGYGIWYRLINLYSVNQTMPFTLLVPGIGVVAGIVLLGEEPSWRLFVGGMMTMLGVAAIIIRRPQTVEETASVGTS